MAHELEITHNEAILIGFTLDSCIGIGIASNIRNPAAPMYVYIGPIYVSEIFTSVMSC